MSTQQEESKKAAQEKEIRKKTPMKPTDVWTSVFHTRITSKAGLAVIFALSFTLSGSPGILNAGDGAGIGAVELDVPQGDPAFVVTTTDEHDDGTCSVLDCTLAEALNVANASAGHHVITFAAGLTGVITNTAVSAGLNILSSVDINGPGPRELSISGGDVSRVFNVQGDPVTISGLTITHGLAQGQRGLSDGDGGAINNSGTLTVTNCTLSNNSAVGPGAFNIGAGSGDGGAIFNSGSLTVSRCTLSGNSAIGGPSGLNRGANGSGGAIFNEGTLTMTNCTLVGNAAKGGPGSKINSYYGSGGSGAGGAIYDSSQFLFTNCTITGNYATGGSGAANSGRGVGGGISESGGDAQIRNTILSGNSASSSGPELAGSVVITDHNLVGAGVNARLGSLANNGGPTDTVALLPDSVAIDGGDDANAPATDQRGLSRVGGHSDIGAFEFTGTPIPTPMPRPGGTPLVRISASATQVVEGNDVTVTVSASIPVATPLTIPFMVKGKARPGSDFTLDHGTHVAIPAGQVLGTVVFHTIADRRMEKNEKVTVSLQKGSGYKVATPKKITFTIVNAP